ncbi:MAG: hypothetical protein R2710_12110 [Acidimicrobiales bacterium]
MPLNIRPGGGGFRFSLAPLTASPAEHRLRRLLSAVALAAGTLLFAFGVDPAGAELASDAEPTWGVSGQLDSASNNFAAEVWDSPSGATSCTPAASSPPPSRDRAAAPCPQRARRVRLAQRHADRVVRPRRAGRRLYAVELSPDGSRLFIAGEFTSVEGVDNTAGLAALDPVTGALDPTWRAGLERPWTDAPRSAAPSTCRGRGSMSAATSPTSTPGPSGASSSRRPGIARHRRARCGLRSPGRGRRVWDIEPSVDGSRLYLAGFFSTVNGDATYGDRFAAVQTSNGQLVPGVAPFEPNLDRTGRQYAIAVTNDLVFVGGEEHMLQVLDGQTLERRQLYFGGSPSFLAASPLYGGGDFQVLETVGDRVYAGCHCWNYLLESSQGPTLFPTNVFSPGTWTPIRSVAAFDGASGDRLDDVQFDLSGAGGAWALRGATDGCLWVGGDITQSGGKWLSGIGRFCDESVATDTERPTTPKA